MDADLFTMMTRVAESLESAVPSLKLIPHIFEPEWLEDDSEENADTLVGSSDGGEWINPLGYEMIYQGQDHGSFQHTCGGSDRERLLSVLRQLMSDVQDIISEATKEPFPFVIVQGRRQMAMPEAIIEGDLLYMWFGNRSAPALKFPAVDLL